MSSDFLGHALAILNCHKDAGVTPRGSAQAGNFRGCPIDSGCLVPAFDAKEYGHESRRLNHKSARYSPQSRPHCSEIGTPESLRRDSEAADLSSTPEPS